jgi:hypothetical protein
VKLDPRRRFRDRLLIGMVAVALLPLAAFAILAVLDLDAVGRSTAEAAQGAILQDEQARQASTLASQSGLVDARLDQIGSEVAQLLSQASHEIATIPAKPAAAPTLTDFRGTGYAGFGGDASTVLAPASPTTEEARLLAATAGLVAQMQAVRRDFPEVVTVWVANDSDTALRAVPGFNVPAAVAGGRVDRSDVFNASRQRFIASQVEWADPRSTARGVSAPFWTNPYPLLSEGTGISALLPSRDGHLVAGCDVSIGRLLSTALSSATATQQPAASYPLLLGSDGTVLMAGGDAAADLNLPPDPVGSPLTGGGRALEAGLKRAEASGQPSMLSAQLSKVPKDMFLEPVVAGRWLLARVVPVSDLEPDLRGLTAGITTGVHRLFPLLVLPALVLLLALAFVAATILSRRLVVPVRNLTGRSTARGRPSSPPRGSWSGGWRSAPASCAPATTSSSPSMTSPGR